MTTTTVTHTSMFEICSRKGDFTVSVADDVSVCRLLVILILKLHLTTRLIEQFQVYARNQQSSSMSAAVLYVILKKS